MHYRFPLALVCAALTLPPVSARPAAPAASLMLDPPRVITRCAIPAELAADSRQAPGHAGTAALPGLRSDLLTLVKQSGEYDVLVGRNSLGNGALINAGGAENPIHLLRNPGGDPEHFLFMLDLDGSGELLWSTGTGSAVVSCMTAAAGQG